MRKLLNVGVPRRNNKLKINIFERGKKHDTLNSYFSSGEIMRNKEDRCLGLVIRDVLIRRTEKRSLTSENSLKVNSLLEDDCTESRKRKKLSVIFFFFFFFLSFSPWMHD